MEQVAVVADRDETGQSSLVERHVIHMPELQEFAHAHLVVFGQEGRGAFRCRFMHDEFQRQLAQQRCDGRCEHRDIGIDQRSDVHDVY